MWESAAALGSLAWSRDGRTVRWTSGGAVGELDPGSPPGALPPTGPPTPGAADFELLSGGDRVAVRSAGETESLTLLPASGGSPKILDRWRFQGLSSLGIAGDRRHVLYVRDGRYSFLDTRTGARTATRLAAQKLTLVYW